MGLMGWEKCKLDRVSCGIWMDQNPTLFRRIRKNAIKDRRKITRNAEKIKKPPLGLGQGRVFFTGTQHHRVLLSFSKLTS